MSIDEYRCLYVEIMKQLQEKIKDLVDMASDEKFYMDNKIKGMIVDDYNKLLKFYKVIRTFFDNQIDNVLKDKSVVSEENEKVKSIDTNIYFLLSNNDGKIFFESDLKDVQKNILIK